MGETRHVAMRFFYLVPYHVRAVDQPVSQVRSGQVSQVRLVWSHGQVSWSVRSGQVMLTMSGHVSQVSRSGYVSCSKQV